MSIEDLHDFTSPPNIVRMIMSGRKREEGVSDARGTRQKFILFFDEEGERLRNLNVLWSIILKLIISRMARRGVNLSGSGWGQMSGSCTFMCVLFCGSNIKLCLAGRIA